MTIVGNRPRPVRTLVEVRKSSSMSSAPNGSVRNVTDHYTYEIFDEVWPEYEEPEISSKGLHAEPTGRMRKGTYSGARYRTVHTYISGDASHRGQFIGNSSGPWPEGEAPARSA